MGQCDHGCPELSHIEARCRNREVHPGWSHHANDKRADAHDTAVAEADVEIHKQVWETVILARAAHAHVNLHVSDWVTTQQKDPILKAVIEWISNSRVQDLKHLLEDGTIIEEEKAILHERKKLTLYQGALYHHHTLAGRLEEVLWFVVPMAHSLLP